MLSYGFSELEPEINLSILGTYFVFYMEFRMINGIMIEIFFTPVPANSLLAAPTLYYTELGLKLLKIKIIGLTK